VRAFCELTSVGSTGGCATAQPIALTAITDIPTATAVLMTNRLMLLFRMIASIHECDPSRLWAARPVCTENLNADVMMMKPAEECM
jgi:hypothetical protein